MKKIIALLLVMVMALSLCACANTSDKDEQGGAQKSNVIVDSNNDGQIEVGTVDDVEVNQQSEHLDAHANSIAVRFAEEPKK